MLSFFAMDHKAKIRLLALFRRVSQRNFAAYNHYMHLCNIFDRESYFARFLPGKRVRYVRPEEPEYEPYPDIRGLTCGARTRKGTPCKNRELSLNGRCKFHGGKSTGAKTKAGRKRQREGYRAWLEKQRSSKAGRKRTRTYTDDAQQLGRATLAEISTSTTGDDLQPVSDMTLRRMENMQLVVNLPNGESAEIGLATTGPHFGGVCWWYVCPSCQTRRTALYVNDNALVCRQCAGIHYASQSTEKIRVADRS